MTNCDTYVECWLQLKMWTAFSYLGQTFAHAVEKSRRCAAQIAPGQGGNPVKQEEI